ncbi:MAG: efflux RND transporter permease subunit [Gammaproteobacteria bacterium]
MFESLVRNGLVVTVATLIVCVLGVAAALRIPVQMIPDLEVRTVTVRTEWPGATPQDIEHEILIEQEKYLRTVPSLKRLIAMAESSRAEIELEFPFGIDVTETLVRVNNALSQVPGYPENVDQPRIYAAAFSANSFMYFRIAPLPGNPRGLDMDMQHDFIDDQVRTRMETVPGVSQVEVRGGAEREVRVLLQAARLAERGLTVGDVRERLRARNRDVSGGEIEGGKRRYLLRTIGRFDSVDALSDLVLARQGDAVTTLGEVATIVLDHRELRDHAYVNGQPVIQLAVQREEGSNVIAIKRAMMAEVAAINRDLLEPAGMDLALVSDDVRYVEESLFNVWKNLLLGALLATLVMYAFLRSARATLVGVIGIPVCTIAAFLGLMACGRTVNVISLAGVAFAIGMTLDNSIVVLESIELERRRGLDRLAAAVAGIRRVWPAVLASTLTTILVFVPIVFIAEEAGQLYSDIAIAVSSSILVSMLVAITVVPTAGARFGIESGAGGRGWSRRTTLAAVDWMLARRVRRLVCVIVVVAACAAVIILLTPPAEYLPEGEEPKAFATMNAPPGYNLAAMERMATAVQAWALPAVGADRAAYDHGEAALPPLEYVNLRVAPQQLRAVVAPLDAADIESLIQAFTDHFESYPGMRAFVARGSIITSNDGGTRSIDVDVSGPRLEAIYDVALAVYERAREVFDEPRILPEPPTLTLSQPLVEVRPDWRRAAELGIDAGEIGLAVAALTDGAYADEFFLGDDKIDVFLYGEHGDDVSVDALDDLLVHAPRGAALPLASVARVVETVDTSMVRRVNGRRTVTLHVIPPRNVALETGVARVRDEVVGALREAGRIPADVSVTLSGASDQLEATRHALSDNYAVALIVVYLLLAAIFGHWGYPLLIMTTIPLGIAGGVAGLALLNAGGALLPAFGFAAVHQPFDMISMLGFLILMGTVVNNPILIVHRAVTNVREEGLGPVQAVAEAVASRLRPIAMSTVTTVCGLAPLVFLPGAGAELYRGVGAIVLFGLLGTAAVTVTYLPAVTVSLLRRR